jgi:hypothetical protein
LIKGKYTGKEHDRENRYTCAVCTENCHIKSKFFQDADSNIFRLDTEGNIYCRDSKGNEEMITLREALFILKQKYGYEIEPGTVNNWSKRGIIDGPIPDTNGAKGTDSGGRQCKYENDLPDKLAVIKIFNELGGHPLSKIGIARKIATGLMNNNLNEVIKNENDIKDFYVLLGYYRDEHLRTKKECDFFDKKIKEKSRNPTQELLTMIYETEKDGMPIKIIENLLEKYQLVFTWIQGYHAVKENNANYFKQDLMCRIVIVENNGNYRFESISLYQACDEGDKTVSNIQIDVVPENCACSYCKMFGMLEKLQ